MKKALLRHCCPNSRTSFPIASGPTDLRRGRPDSFPVKGNFSQMVAVITRNEAGSGEACQLRLQPYELLHPQSVVLCKGPVPAQDQASAATFSSSWPRVHRFCHCPITAPKPLRFGDTIIANASVSYPILLIKNLYLNYQRGNN